MSYGGILRCPLHYCGVHKGLINHIITPVELYYPYYHRQLKLEKGFGEKTTRPYLSFHLEQCCIWRFFFLSFFFNKTLNLGNRPVASYLRCTVWPCGTKKCANTNDKVHWLLCSMCHFHFLRCKKIIGIFFSVAMLIACLEVKNLQKRRGERQEKRDQDQ